MVVTSGKERMFCAGANIYMLGTSTHAWKVNFCKFTNETRNGIEDSSRHSGLKFLAALNGTTAGGGYELALACDEIVLIDDRSSTVSLPEVPLLGVLPGTGGLTRLVDKRKVRRDLADVFCTTAEGVRAERAQGMAPGRLIGAAAAVRRGRARERAEALAKASDRPADAKGVALPPLAAHASTRAATTTTTSTSPSIASGASRRSPSRRPGADQPAGSRRHPRRRRPRGGRWRWRASSTTRSCCCAPTSSSSARWLLKTRGDASRPCSPTTSSMLAHRGNWFVRETIGIPAPHAGAPRRLLAQLLRRHRARLLLRRHAPRAGARRRPQLHAALPDGDNDAPRSRSRASISASARW